MGNKIVKFQNKLIRLQIANTKGQERFRTITKTYYNNKNGIILMYNVNDHSSFDFIRNLIKQVDSNARTNASKILVGNISCESSRVINEDEGKKLANEFNLGYFEISVNNNINIDDFFEYITEDIMKKNNHLKESTIHLQKNENKERKKGCA